jgi:hypothetical protein
MKLRIHRIKFDINVPLSLKIDDLSIKGKYMIVHITYKSKSLNVYGSVIVLSKSLNDVLLNSKKPDEIKKNGTAILAI